MELEFTPIDYDYFDFEGRNYAKIIGRDKKGKRVCIIDSCPVYLWAILKEDLKDSKIKKLIPEIEKISLNVKGRNTKVEKVELQDKKFLDKPVKALKIYATNYKDLHDIADKLDFPEIIKRRGYDLGFITHYIIEKKLYPLQTHKISGEILNNSLEFGGIDMALNVDLCIKLNSIKPLEKSKDFKPKTLAYDIETDALEIGKGEILMVSLYGENYKKVITWKKDSSEKTSDLKYVEYVKDESELLEKFIDCVKDFSPDFLVGYFSDGFDLPYIKARSEKLKVKLSLGLDDSQPKFSRSGPAGTTGKIFGITHIDILKFIRTTYSQYLKSETLTLNEVAKEFLGDEKKDFKIKHSSNIKNPEHWKEYYEYNLHDSKLTFQIFEKILPDLIEFTRVIKEPPFEISRNGLSKQVESYILHNLERFNEIPEKRPGHDEIGKRKYREKVEGAFVLEPKPGLYENIVMFDFTSMHTSIIISMNISKSTFLEEPDKTKKKNATHIKTKLGDFYFTKKPGFFPELLNEIFQRRKHFKKLYQKSPDPITKARSNAFKLLSASAHGYIGFFGARYYSLESSSAILAFVRKFNKEAISAVEKSGFHVIYGDTDSVAFTREGKSKIEIKNFLKKLNESLPGIMELELDGFFKRGIWVTTRAGTLGAKKKYALLPDDGAAGTEGQKIKIRGFETVRRDWCQLARKLQNKIIELILKNGNEKNALEYLKKIIEKLKNREIPLEDIIIKTQLKKPISEYKSISPHVVAAKKMQELDIPVSQGNLVEYYIAETPEKKKLVREKVKLPQESGEYNKEYYLEKQILPAVENIFQVFGVDVKTLINKKNQMTLEGF